VNFSFQIWLQLKSVKNLAPISQNADLNSCKVMRVGSISQHIQILMQNKAWILSSRFIKRSHPISKVVQWMTIQCIKTQNQQMRFSIMIRDYPEQDNKQSKTQGLKSSENQRNWLKFKMLQRDTAISKILMLYFLKGTMRRVLVTICQMRMKTSTKIQ